MIMMGGRKGQGRETEGEGRRVRGREGERRRRERERTAHLLHVKVGWGTPDAKQLKVIDWPTSSAALAGGMVITGGTGNNNASTLVTKLNTKKLDYCITITYLES